MFELVNNLHVVNTSRLWIINYDLRRFFILGLYAINQDALASI